MLQKTAKKNAFNNKLMSLALATGITAQAVPFTTHLLPNITQNVLAHADDNQSENFSYTLQTKDENGKVVVSDKITFTKNDDGTYKVTDEAGLLKNNTSNVKIDDMMNIQLNNLIDSTKELNWISQNGQYKLADNHESATPDDQGNLTFAVVKNTTNKDNGGNSDSTAPTTPTDDNKDHNQSGSDSSNTTPAKPTDNNKDNDQSGSKENQEQSVVYHLNLVNDGKTVKTDTITFTPKGDGSYTVKDDAGLAITSDYTPSKDDKGVLTFDLNNALNSGLINWINDGTWQLDGAQSVQTSGQDVNYKVVKADSNHQGDPATSPTNVVLNLVDSANNKVVKTDTFTFTPMGEDGHYLVTDTAGLAPAVDYVAQKVDGKYNFDINSVVSANTLGGWVNDGTWTLDSNKQEGTKGEDGSLNFYVTHAKTDAGYLQSFKEKYPSDKYGIVNQNGSTFTFVQFDPSTKQVTYMGTIDMSQANPQATKLNDGTTSYTRTFTRTIYGLFDGEKRQITAQSANMTVTQHTTFVGDNQPLKTNLTYSQAKFDAYKPTVVPNGYKLVKEVDVPEMSVDQNTPSLSSAEQMSEYQSVNTDSGSGAGSNAGTPDSGNPSSDSHSSTPDSDQTSSGSSNSGSSSTPGSGDSSSDSGSSSTPTKPDSGSGSSSTPTKPDSGSDSSSTPTKPDSGSDSSSTPTTSDSGSDQNSSASPSTPTKPDSGSDQNSSASPSTPTKPDSGSDQSSSASSSTPTAPSSGSSSPSTPSSNTSSAAPSSNASSSVSSGASSSTSSHASSSTSSSTSSHVSSNTNSNTSSHALSATSSNTSSHATSGASSKANSNTSSASANSSAPNSQSTTLPSEAAAKFNSMPTTSSNGTINPLAQTNARNNGNQALALSMLGGSLVIGGLGLGLLNKRKEE